MVDIYLLILGSDLHEPLQAVIVQGPAVLGASYQVFRLLEVGDEYRHNEAQHLDSWKINTILKFLIFNNDNTEILPARSASGTRNPQY